MPRYEFICESRHVTEQVLPITKAPDLGEAGPACPTCGQPTVRCIVTAPTFADAKLKADSKYPYVSRQWRPDQLPGVKRTTPQGHAIIESAQHERNIAAAGGFVRD